MVYQIMNKCIAKARQGKPLGITSAVASQSKGRIYIESFSEPAVKEAVLGIRGIQSYSMRLLPINDMTTVMSVTAKKRPGKHATTGNYNAAMRYGRNEQMTREDLCIGREVGVHLDGR